MNTPTKLTVSRIVLTIVMIFILLFPFYDIGVEFPRLLIGGIYVKSEYLVAGVIFLIASLTDFIDGYLARKNHQVTDLGKMLDAIADKALVNSALIILAVQGFVPAIIPVVVIFRDTIVDAIKMEASSKGRVVAAIGSGKIKTATMMIGLVLTFFYNLPFEMWNLRISDFFLYFAMIMSIVSMIEYFNLNKNLIFKKKEESEGI
ncbi:MAG TPA: CDP-diacylglycerol--glycerol-3-phosphate 3-phosphatidyltransferase [Candidatus Onthousia faecigallinarum]|nr:CDP-diacylglycerol--glycerol-3-phosphate 3-phosphatidyltransferase [Candidatus Onthousia faecigallinarum]